jgi:hypothetical protein
VTKAYAKSKRRSKAKSPPIDLVKLALEESLATVDRFSAEPVFGPTGKGYLKSSGVAELQALKDEPPAKR